MAFKHGFSATAAAFCALMALPVQAEDAVDASTVVATVNGTEITVGHMIVLKQRLPAQYQQLSPDVLFNGVLDQLVQQTLLGEDVETLSLSSQLSLDNETRSLRAGWKQLEITEHLVDHDL